jgi:glutathione S-transferase
MIDCYTWTTDNGYKPRMMLEETGLPHRIIPVNIREKAQMSPDFLKLSPGHKIPAIVDHDGPGGATVTLCESGAILKYLGEKSGKFYPADAAARAKVDQWLFYVGWCAIPKRCRLRRNITTLCFATCSARSTVILLRTNTSAAAIRLPT